MKGPDIQKHVNAQVSRLVMELATAHAVIEQLEAQIVQQTSSPSGEASGSERPNGARGADGSGTGEHHG